MIVTFTKRTIAMAIIKTKVNIPQARDHEKIIERGLKNPSIDKVKASVAFSVGTIECTYNEKKHSQQKIVREINATLQRLGYKSRY
jgi:phage-related protein